MRAPNETPRPPDPARLEADKWAKRAAFGMLLAGAILILVPAAFHLREAFGDPFKPRQSTTVERKISGASGDRAKVVSTIVRGPGPRAVTTTQTTRPGTRTTETTTSEDADQESFAKQIQELASELADGLAEQAEATQRAAALAASATRALAELRPAGGAQNPS